MLKGWTFHAWAVFIGVFKAMSWNILLPVCHSFRTQALIINVLDLGLERALTVDLTTLG